MDERQDHHVHSTFSDDAVSTLDENVAAASDRGLRVLRLVDHVRLSTTWVPDFLAAVAALDVPDGLEVCTGVEAKILDSAGRLDLPDGLGTHPGVDRVLVADHQFPGADGPVSPRVVRDGILTPQDAADALDVVVTATVAAMHQVDRAQIAHLFSLLPKIGVSEDQVTDEHVAALGAAAAATGTTIEVNEKWACPGPRVVRALLAAGVELVVSTDSHVASDVGRYARVSEILRVADSS
ncbi:PHP domain-containing protein [Sanguibacter antarcticus]|uniref:PHP domain-containing protein n=1 Tax=Sanguibacter antarcticus TaxID=372484 RepID=UPI003CCC17C7